LPIIYIDNKKKVKRISISQNEKYASVPLTFQYPHYLAPAVHLAAGKNLFSY